MSAKETVNTYLRTFEEGGDPSALLADHFSFDGPLLKATSKQEFLKGMSDMPEMKMRFEMLKQFEDGNEVCSIYNFIVGTTPILMFEWSKIEENLLVSQRLRFDVRAFESAISN